MTVDEIVNALRSIAPGQSVIYYRGFLSADRCIDSSNPNIFPADLALSMYRSGRITLIQKRMGPPMRGPALDWHHGCGPGFEYIAIGAMQKANITFGAHLRTVLEAV